MQTFVLKHSGLNKWTHKTKIKLMHFCLLIAFFVLSVSAANAQTITLSSANPAVNPGSLYIGVNSQIIYKATIVLSGSGYGVNFNSLTFTATGTFTTSDIYYASGNNGYKVWLSTSDNFSSALCCSNPTAASSSGNTVNITVYNPWLTVGTTYYMWITADVSTSATPGHTLTVNALNTGSFTFSGGTKSGTLYAGGTQTVPLKQYRSKNSGNWNNASTWEQSADGGTTWANTSSTPTSADGPITIQNGHTVTVTNSVSTDETTINTGGQITVNGGVTLTVADGTGTDLNVNGTIVNQGTISSTGTIAFNSKSTYQHSQNGGTIPTATWDATSSCVISGVTNSAPGGVNQTFGNFSWGSGQTTYVSLSPSSMSIQGNLEITDTGNPYDFAIEQNITIGGNLIVRGGTYRVTYANSRSHTVKGDLIITGGTLDLNSGTNSYTSNIYLNGNLTISGGTLTESGTGNGNITFNGPYIQIFRKTGGAITKTVNFSVSSGSTLDVGTSILTGSGTFTLNSGAGIITANAQGISTTASTGSIQVTGTKNYNSGANYTYDGTVAQVTGNGLNVYNPANLTINNNAGVTLSAATSISGVLYLLNGNLSTTTTNILTLTNTNSNAISGGSATSFINGPVKWNLPSNMSSGFTYNVPLGSGTTFLPFAMVNPVTGSTSPAVTIQAFAGTFTATATVGGGLSSVSKTEYWSLKASNNYLTSSSFSLGRAPSVFPYDAIGYSTATSYTSINGTPDPYFIKLSDSKAIGNKITRYFALGVKSSTTPEIFTSEQALTGFTYVYDQGPSAEQSFAIDGSKLTSNITITPPTHFEISTKSGIGYQSTAITLTQSGGNVPLDTIYVRLKSGLAVGTYNSETISITSGTLSKTILCNGNVTLTATSVTASGDYNCSTGTISLSSSTSGYISNVYWLGPNNYYSNAANPTIPSATSANSGTYTAYGSILSGLNLITNGGFESGNSGFTSSYTYQAPNGDHTVWNEGTYTIAADPHAVHANFSSCPDHTIGGSTPTGNQMIINGSGASNVTIWSQTVSVLSNTNYQFTYWLQSVISDSPSQLQLYVNGVAAGPVYTASTTTCSYNQYFYNWNSGTATTAILSLVNQNTATSGNDFTLDDIVFQPVTQISSSVIISTTNTSPAVSISPSASIVNAGSTVTYTASPTNSGTAPTYQWKVNGINVGTNSPVFTYVPSAGDVVTCEMTSNGSCSNGVKVTSNPITVTVNSRKNYWIGGVSNDWTLASNWSDHVPSSGEDIVFASTNAGYSTEAARDLILDANRTVGKVIITSTSIKSLIIPAGKCLTVNDSIVTLNSNPDLIHLQASPTAESGSLVFFGKTKPVNATVDMYSKASWNLSSPTNYKYKWQFFGIPVKSITASPTFDGSYVRQYDESGTTINNHWIQLSNNSVMTPFTGYEMTQSGGLTYTVKGQLLNNDTTLLLKYTSGSLYPGQNIVSNPYAGAISISKITFGSETEPTVYIYNTGTYKEWESNGQSQSDTVTTTAGQYIAIPQNVAGTGTIPAQIPSTQAFLVKAKSNSPNATITLKYNNIIIRNKEQKRAKPVETSATTDKSYLQINVKGTKRSDTTWLFDEASCSHDYDDGWDGYKFFGSTLSPQIFANENEIYYQINTSNNLTDTYIGFQPGEDSEYTLTFNTINLSDKYKKLYLTDLAENQTINLLNEGAVYKFSTSNTNLNSKRFRITGDRSEVPSIFKIYSTSNVLFIDNTSNLSGFLYLYDLTGKCKMIQPFQPNAISSYDVDLPKGFYIIKAVTEKDNEEKKVYISGI